MKKSIKITVFTALLCLLVLSLVACGGDRTYKDKDTEGFTVSVRFDVNGGQLAGQSGIYVVDTFNPNNYQADASGNIAIPLLKPDDPIRGNGAYTVQNHNYVFAGWFASKDVRKDASGNLLDEYGQPITGMYVDEKGYLYDAEGNRDRTSYFVDADGNTFSRDEDGNWLDPDGNRITEVKNQEGSAYFIIREAGEDQIFADDEARVSLSAKVFPKLGYVYSDKWDFESDRLSIKQDGEYTSAEPQLTLYAAWVPYFHYEFYAENANGEYEYIDTVIANRLDIPSWNDKTGRLQMERFPTRRGMTFDGAYLDAEKQIPLTETYYGEMNLENGTTSQKVIKIYTEWLEGSWFHIHNTDQFFDNYSLTASFLLCADLDFTGKAWPAGLARGTYSGTIDGQGHTISGVSLVQDNANTATRGLFGQLSDTAVLKDVAFENIRYTVKTAPRGKDISFGLLAGTASEQARIENVTVTGEIIIDNALLTTENLSVGLISSSGMLGIDASGITYSVSGEGDRVSIDGINEDGTLNIVIP